MVGHRIPICVVSGYSGSGKTTLVEGLLELFVQKSLRVATAKHHRGSLEVDQPGKDSWKHRKAGAVATFLVAENGVTAFMDNKPEMSPGDLLKLCPEGTDLLLVEGFKEMRGYPRVEVCRDRAPTDGDDLVCVVGHFPPPRPGVPVFSPDDIAGIADCILQKVLGR